MNNPNSYKLTIILRLFRLNKNNTPELDMSANLQGLVPQSNHDVDKKIPFCVFI
ncbi:uncharacterized protein ASCRUDRAFT_76535 [Ascoidea rubescens DSM 1968]|uniref:Uncharacterized protein n=1 Tax=Ascoidea rubescens DSM 1968 TaxID=1344418 RepID=A0A1D2VEF0_9ASCO|nr:hypothetical protein ASCRUDRAFT_78349 [Ascoidea rubescens DSM 1968]XP_020046302.1 hypothetical protein ASCRUDRAFT_76909 [Ascoidea rubescens DSM 1968]XP_020046307.1 hypothetical protein ASCRUDRAFT_76535 [Ascoidea rubescens DSM 1968]ODV57842.1 hypothetical protein ASCRUDRAFT_78349 [Ascoidea rubescens DSM 1968]ODV59995.1 hypothetical protein ASCRUDRAFT_76909 [Ascoidea rubescens DSM 1968]ODV60000.1 hypothetical protein ASCRUDRAFT_76535 [Ascoidea rubescens DSM 1968]